MAYLKIIHEGDPMLRQTSRPVTEITPRILQLLDDMTDTMHRANGCGLAAVQVGVLRRVVVIEVEEGKTLELINPKIVSWSGEQCEVEGCLSLPKPSQSRRGARAQPTGRRGGIPRRGSARAGVLP